jgi:hypothetical protein
MCRCMCPQTVCLVEVVGIGPRSRGVMRWNEKRIKVVLRRYNWGKGIDGGKGRAEVVVNFMLDSMKWMRWLLIEFRRIACDSFLDMSRNVAQRRCEQCSGRACAFACGGRSPPSKISERSISSSTSTCTSPEMGRIPHCPVSMVTDPFAWVVYTKCGPWRSPTKRGGALVQGSKPDDSCESSVHRVPFVIHTDDRGGRCMPALLSSIGHVHGEGGLICFY